MNITVGYDNILSTMTRKELALYVQSKGKRANQRLREVEKSGLQKSSAAYRYIERQVFDADSAYTHTGRGEIKFNVNTRGLSLGELRHRAAEISGFLESKTSTVTGIKKIIDKAEKTWEKKHPSSDISYKDFGEALTYTLFREFEKAYGSGEAVKIKERAGDLDDEALEIALKNAGFVEGAGYGADNPPPALKTIYGEIDRMKEFMQNLGGAHDIDGIFGGDTGL